MGCTVFRTDELRECIYSSESGDENLRLFGVFDTASEKDKSHADVFRLSGGQYDKAHKKRAKALLFILGNQWLVNSLGVKVQALEL